MDESERLVAVAALASPERALAAWREWRASTEIAEATALLTWAGGYIHRNLAAAGVDEPYLAGIHRYNLIANSRRLVAALPVLRALAAQWEVTPLKSFGMPGAIYSRGLRPIADIDFVTSPRDPVGVHRLLIARGLEPLLGVTEYEFVTRIVPARGSWNYLAGEVDLDSHWRMFEHLEISADDALVRRNSRLEDSEFGRIRRLDDELMLMGILVHYALSGGLNGLFDVVHLLKTVDIDRVARLARELAAERTVSEVCEQVQAILGDEPVPAVRRLAAAVHRTARRRPQIGETVTTTPLFEPIPARFFESTRLARPRLYRAWQALGRPRWIERLLARSGHTLSRTDAEPDAGYPEGGGRLGPGWFHLYPGDRFRWTAARDARVVFHDVSPETQCLRIVLDATHWHASPAHSFAVVVNGRMLGRLDKTAHVVEFPIRSPERTVEVSLRRTGVRRFRDPGVARLRLRFAAPVAEISLRPYPPG